MVKTSILKIVCKDCRTTLGVIESLANPFTIYSDDISVDKIEYKKNEL